MGQRKKILDFYGGNPPEPLEKWRLDKSWLKNLQDWDSKFLKQ
jgi:hypothetical protein